MNPTPSGTDASQRPSRQDLLQLVNRFFFFSSFILVSGCCCFGSSGLIEGLDRVIKTRQHAINSINYERLNKKTSDIKNMEAFLESFINLLIFYSHAAHQPLIERDTAFDYRYY